MTQTFEQIKQFYRSHWQTLKPFDLAMTCSHVAMSLNTGRLELSHFDGYMNRKLTIAVLDRLEAAETLKLLADELIDRVKLLTPAEIEDLDRVRRVLAGVSELPKRLDNRDL